jgi:hypothetical protein
LLHDSSITSFLIRSPVQTGVELKAGSLPVSLDAPAEPWPELLILDDDQTGELVVAADQVEPEPSALGSQPVRHVEEPPHRLRQPVRVHRHSSPAGGHRTVDFDTPEQLLFHLA